MTSEDISEKANAAARLRTAPVRSVDDLISAQLVPLSQIDGLAPAAKQLAIRITPVMLSAMNKDIATDPIAAQFVPSAKETVYAPEEIEDPIGDTRFSPTKGIVHRYPDRVLLKPIHVCPVYCRFCFRRDVVGPGSETLASTELDAAMDYIGKHSEIWEVILSGGDPLMLSADRLRRIFDQLQQIDHVRVLRVHTRVPIADPDRITDQLVDALTTDRALYVVIHCNHRAEIGQQQVSAINRLRNARATLLSQSVLLRGVNDTAATMGELMRRLVEVGVKPYYLHHLDLTRGTGHFRTSISQGRQIMTEMRGRLSGLCQPTYVVDIPGGHGKVPIGPTYLREEGGRTFITDYCGQEHQYPQNGTSDE